MRYAVTIDNSLSVTDISGSQHPTMIKDCNVRLMVQNSN